MEMIICVQMELYLCEKYSFTHVKQISTDYEAL